MKRTVLKATIFAFLLLYTAGIAYAPILPPGNLPIADPNLQVHLKFEGDLQDSSGKGNNGIMICKRGEICSLAYAQGKSGQALSFPGNYAIRLPERAKVGSKEFTIMAWAKPDFSLSNDQDNYASVITEYNENLATFYLFGIGNDGSTGVTYRPTGPAPVTYEENFDKNWVHIAAVNTNENQILYINGIKVGESGGKITIRPGILQRSFKLLIGGSEATSNQEIITLNLYTGLMDEVKIYDAAISEAEIKKQIEKCSGDSDCDEVTDASDNCPQMPNPSQKDSDEDGKGNVCEGIPFTEINCNDKLDNDLDQKLDCMDSDCANDAACKQLDAPILPGNNNCTNDNDCEAGETCQDGSCIILSACESQGGLICETECGDFSTEDTASSTAEGKCCIGLEDTTGELLQPNCGLKSPAANTCDYYGTEYGVGTSLCSGECAEGSEDITTYDIEQPIDALEGQLCCVSENPDQVTCEVSEFISALGASVTVGRTPCIDEDGDGEGYSKVSVTEGSQQEYFDAIGITQLEEDGTYNEPCTTLPKGDKAGEIVSFIGYWSLLVMFIILILFYTKNKIFKTFK